MADPQHEALLAELRTLVRRTQEHAQEIGDRATVAKNALREERREVSRLRQEAEQEAARDAREGGLGRARRELQQRLDREQTTWRQVMTGEDTHWSAVEVREQFGRDFEAGVRRLRDEDDDFRAEQDAAVDLARRRRESP